jgi:cephalosporin hydroxylase
MNAHPNDLEAFFMQHQGPTIAKWMHYFEIYDRYLSPFRGRPITILEIGVSHGGSMHMWKSYFGKEAKIYGVDINPKSKQIEDEQIKIFIGSQTDEQFLQNILSEIGPIDILIDDGGHTMDQQIITFKTLYHGLSENGVYICEDCHTSYWIDYNGGHKRRGTFIEFSKNLVDQLNAYHSEQSSLKVNAFTQSTFGIHFYDSVVVMERRKIAPPRVERRGHDAFVRYVPPTKPLVKLKKKLAKAVLLGINEPLRALRLKGFTWR